MNIFKNLFGSKEKSLSLQTTDLNKNYTEGKIISKFNGIDTAFIDLLFFKNDKEKKNFISNILNTLETLCITNETHQTEFMTTFSNYVHENEIELPFIAELFVFESKIVTKLMPSGLILNTTNTSPSDTGIKKLNSYKTALRLVSCNLDSKIKNGIIDISFEENIVINNLTEENMDFHMINILYQLGNAFMQSNALDKMAYYFGYIYNSQFELSPNTVSDYVRYAGEDYYKIGNLTEALKFLKKGIELNPKLGVKKLISEIENKLK
jgi:hypothetical protein